MAPGYGPRELNGDLRSFLESGDAKALSSLMTHLTTIVEARSARLLLRRQRYGRDARQELPDLVQEVFIALLENDARVLRAWDPKRGMSLENFVGLVTEREVASILRSGKRTPFREPDQDFMDEEGQALTDDAAPVDARMVSKEMLVVLLDRTRSSLSPLGLELFERLVVAEETVEEVSLAMHMNVDAVYAWKSRLGKKLRTLAAELARASSQQRVATS